MRNGVIARSLTIFTHDKQGTKIILSKSWVTSKLEGFDAIVEIRRKSLESVTEIQKALNKVIVEFHLELEITDNA